jgi:hypothetical protein
MSPGWPADGSFFVSIAAYRDPDLLPTIADGLAMARHPERLRFGICWQYGSELIGSEQLSGSQFAVHYVDARLSRGVCWARAEIMKLYDGEDWYLQLDSHHRFTQDWDEKLVEQAGLTGSSRPVLSSYAAGFTPGREAEAAEHVTTMEFDCFTEHGVLLPKPAIVPEPRVTPIRARFISAHFLFTVGSFVRDVPYDPELYFLGEEITLAVRAFTHGYDLFHPARHIVWHEYTRAGRAKHWDDHTHETGTTVPWWEQDAPSQAKAGRFLAEPWQGCDGAGSVRSVADYEAYAGVSFRHRRVQDYTRLNREPPNPPADEHWPQRVRDHTIQIGVERNQLPRAAFDDPSFWYVGVHDSAGEELFRQDASAAELAERLGGDAQGATLERSFSTEQRPATWTVMPYSASQGWLQAVTGPIECEPRIFISIAAYRDPDLVATIADCLAKAGNPERLRFVICWQHGPEEQLPGWLRPPQFEVIDVDWRASRGNCWARAAIMKRWAGEEWFLQIDSHHRFAPGWDTILLDQAARTGSPRPVLSAPAAAFTVGEPLPQAMPLRADFLGFQDYGIPDIRTGILQDPKAPVRARSICGHQLFAPGRFARDVPYDPDLYFSWEETTMAVRAFTHGYDLFHPATVVTWHEYTGAYRVKHWDDHAGQRGDGMPWHRLREQAIAKVAAFFADPAAGSFGLGEERTFADYEAYAGVSFRHRRVQDYTRQSREPPNPAADPGWPERIRDHRIKIVLDVRPLPEAATADPVVWYIGVHDGDGRELYRQDATGEDLARLLAEDGGTVRFVREFTSDAVPATWTVMPLSASAGWLAPVTGKILANDLPA